MVLIYACDACGNQIWQKCNSVVGGKWLEENVLRTFVCVFLILAMKVSQGVVSCGTDEGVGVGRASVEKVSSQMVNEVADRCDV